MWYTDRYMYIVTVVTTISYVSFVLLVASYILLSLAVVAPRW